MSTGAISADTSNATMCRSTPAAARRRSRTCAGSVTRTTGSNRAAGNSARPSPPRANASSARRRPGRRERSGRREPDGLGLEVFLEAGDAVLAALAALLVAPEGRVGPEPLAPVDRDRSRADTAGDAKCPIEVATVHRAG